MDPEQLLYKEERDEEFWRDLDYPDEQVVQARLIFMRDVEELWMLERPSIFINGFLAAALIWIKDQIEDYYFLLEIEDISIPVGRDYNHYQMTINTTFFAIFRPDGELLTTALRLETADDHYGILVSVQNSTNRGDIIALQTHSLEFVQGLLSAIETFNIHYVLRHKIYKDGVYYDIDGRNLITPTE